MVCSRATTIGGKVVVFQGGSLESSSVFSVVIDGGRQVHSRSVSKTGFLDDQVHPTAQIRSLLIIDGGALALASPHIVTSVRISRCLAASGIPAVLAGLLVHRLARPGQLKQR